MFFLLLSANREIHNLDPQPHRHCMLAPRAFAPRVTRCSLGKYWSRDFFRKRLDECCLDECCLESRHAQLVSRQFQSDPGPMKPRQHPVILSRSDRLPRRWGQQAASLGYTGSLWLIVGGSEIWWCMLSAHSLSSYSQVPNSLGGQSG